MDYKQLINKAWDDAKNSMDKWEEGTCILPILGFLIPIFITPFQDWDQSGWIGFLWIGVVAIGVGLGFLIRKMVLIFHTSYTYRELTSRLLFYQRREKAQEESKLFWKKEFIRLGID